MKINLFFLLFFLPLGLIAQTVIKGVVVDEKTNEKLSGITIYINSSTIGTTTDNEGKFTLNIPFSGKLELVASHLNYEKKVVLVSSDKSQDILIALKPQANILDEVVIKGTKIKGESFNKWGVLFTKILMGSNRNFAALCEIKNPEAMVFYFDKELNELTAYARKPLIIENLALSYRIKLDLENFKYAFNTDVLKFDYSTFFEELPANGDEAYIKKMRLSAYYGSQMHFMRSVYQNNLTNDGFTLYNYRTNKNKERERVNKIVQLKIGQTFAVKNNPNYELKNLFSNKDTIGYYQMILKQNDILGLDTSRISLRKIAVLNRQLDVVKLNFKDTIMVKYKYSALAKEKIGITTIAKINPTKTHDNKNDELNSFMYLVEDGGINVQRNGYFAELILFVYGNMSERRISQVLPWDYDPEKN